MSHRLVLAAVAFAYSACCRPPPAVLSNRWVIVGRGDFEIGLAGAPRYASALAVQPTANAPADCLSSDALQSHFGPTCDNHESEGGAAAGMSREVPLSGPPSGAREVPASVPGTTREVRWYCDKHTVIRILIDRCSATDTFRVVEIAVAHAGG
jgi:hypothetical protein